MAGSEGATLAEADALLRRIGADPELHRRFMAMLEDLHEGDGALAEAAREIGTCDRRRFCALKLMEHRLYEKLLAGFANALATMPSGIETTLGIAGQVLPH